MDKQLKILTVDDEHAITEIIGEFLDLFVLADVTVFNSSKEAISRLENEKFDLIISDHFMPEYSGVEVLKSVRVEKAININTPVLILTSLDSEVQKEVVGIYNDIVVLNKIESLHQIGEIVSKLFPMFKSSLSD